MAQRERKGVGWREGGEEGVLGVSLAKSAIFLFLKWILFHLRGKRLQTAQPATPLPEIMGVKPPRKKRKRREDLG